MKQKGKYEKAQEGGSNVKEAEREEKKTLDRKKYNLCTFISVYSLDLCAHLLDSYMSLFTMYKSRSVQCETTDFLIEIL
jgi:hypothetical protein